MTKLARLAVVAGLAAASLAAASPASAACVQEGEQEYVSVDVCFILRPSYVRCDVYVTGTLYDCKEIVNTTG